MYKKVKERLCMIVLNKKRLVLVVSCIFLSIFVFMLTSTNENGQNDYISTVSLPVSGKTVVIDAGHGIPDEGAESSSRNDRSSN